MPKVNIAAVPPVRGSDYPPPYDRPVADRTVRPLAGPAGIVDIAISHVTLPEGVWSSQRHWHEGEDEFLVMVSGVASLIDDSGETALGPGDCAAFPKNDGNGHHLIGGPGDCVFVVFGRPEASPCHYPDADMVWDDRADRYLRRDRTPY